MVIVRKGPVLFKLNHIVFVMCQIEDGVDRDENAESFDDKEMELLILLTLVIL